MVKWNGVQLVGMEAYKGLIGEGYTRHEHKNIY